MEPDKDKAKDYWDPLKDQNQEYIRTDKIKDSQNRSINGWIKPKSEFETTLYVQNLQPKEIGALLWLLSLNKGLGADNEKHYFKLGYGKPLGFGSVEIEIDTKRLEGSNLPLGTDKHWRAYYANLNDTPPAELKDDQQNQLIQQFIASMVAAYNPLQEDDASNEGRAQLEEQIFYELPFVKGFLKVMQGPVDDGPIHYPRLTEKPDRDGKNYAWFMANERGRHRGEDGKKLALPAVMDDGRLPYTPCES